MKRLAKWIFGIDPWLERNAPYSIPLLFVWIMVCWPIQLWADYVVNGMERKP